MKHIAHRAWLRGRLMSVLLALVLVAVVGPTAAGQQAFGAAASPQVTQAAPAVSPGNGQPSSKARGLNVGHAHIFPAWSHKKETLAASTSPAGSSTDNLINRGGSVQHNPTFYAIFWLPSGNHFEPGIINGDSGYENLMERYLKDADQINLANVIAQYYDSSGYILPNYQHGGDWTDTTAYPHSGSTSDPLQDSDYQAAVNRALAANSSWKDGVNSTFFVFTGSGIQSCLDSSNCTPGVNASGGYCGYHSNFTDASGNTAIYANLPDDESLGLSSQGEGCSHTGALPNGDIYADAVFTTVSHEQYEAETDPLPGSGWTDASGNEIGDKCNSDYGAEPYFGPSNFNVSGDLYVLQQEWSNVDSACKGSASGAAGYWATYGPFLATDASSTGTITLALTTQPPSIDVALTPNPTVDWGDGSSSSASVGTPCAYCTLSGSHSYAQAGTYVATVTYNTGCCISYSTSLHIIVIAAPKPVPTTTSIQPAVVKAGASDTTLTINGTGFVASSTVDLNGTALTTTYVSATQLTATIPAAMLATPTTADVTVVNGAPGGGTSNPQTLYVPLTAAQVTASQSGSGINPQAALPNLSASAIGSGTLVVAQYDSNPGAAFGAGSANRYFDVHIAAGNSFTSVTFKDCDLNGGSQVQWYNPSTGTWVAASTQSYDASTGCATVTVNSSTQPSLAQLSGEPFGIDNLPPVWQPTADQTQDYHDALSFNLKATDPEPADHLTLSVAGGSNLPAGLKLTDKGDGTGTVAGTVQAAAGDYPVTFDVSDAVNPPVAQTVTIHVGHEETTLTYTGDTSISQGGTATLSALLKEDGNTATVPAGQTVTLTLGSGSSAQSCQGQTAVDGTATCQITPVTQALGNQPLGASFAGDADYQAATASATALVYTTTQLTFTGAGGGDYNDPATLAATLVDHAGAPVANEPVTFVLNGAETCANTTDSNGHASCAVTPQEAAGPYTVAISFTGDTTHKPSSASSTFTVTQEQTTLTYTGGIL